jgi:hypothetical protein
MYFYFFGLELKELNDANNVVKAKKASLEARLTRIASEYN